MATSAEPSITDALNAEKDREYRRVTNEQLKTLIEAVGLLTKEVQELKGIRPAPAPVFAAGETVKPPKE